MLPGPSTQGGVNGRFPEDGEALDKCKLGKQLSVEGGRRTAGMKVDGWVALGGPADVPVERQNGPWASLEDVAGGRRVKGDSLTRSQKDSTSCQMRGKESGWMSRQVGGRRGGDRQGFMKGWFSQSAPSTVCPTGHLGGSRNAADLSSRSAGFLSF